MSLPFRNVLFLCQRVPHPPDRGDRISTHHFLRHFREEGCRVRIGCFAEDESDLAAAADLRRLVADICAPLIRPGPRKIWSLRGLLAGQPLTLPYFGHRRLWAAVRRWTAEDPADVVFMYSSSMGQYAWNLDQAARVMHFAELDSDKWRQYAAKSGLLGRFVYAREARKLLEYERRIARQFDAALLVSEAERELFERFIPDVVPTVVPNGVDVEHFATKGDEARGPHTVIFTGVMDYEPNVDGVLWFAEACWPRVREVFPDARFLVVGKRPVPSIRRLDGRAGIEVTGWVEETPPYFDQATVGVAPLRLARGLQNKVLEAMSMGLPVVATPQAARGVGEVDADTLRVAEDADEITDSVVRFLRDPELARATGRRAAAFVRERFRWRNMFERLDAVLERVHAAREAVR